MLYSGVYIGTRGTHRGLPEKRVTRGERKNNDHNELSVG